MDRGRTRVARHVRPRSRAACYEPWRLLRYRWRRWVMDTEAADVYLKYIDEMTQFASSIAGPFSADELASDALHRALASTRWQEARNLRAYLFRCVVNEARSSARSLNRRLKREVEFARRSHQPSTADVSIAVLESLATLSIRQRSVICLTYWCGYDAAGVADTLDLARRTVERELAVSKQRLRKQL